MALYKYKAMTAEGRNIAGTHEAESKNEVIIMLKESKSIPIEILEAPQSKDVMDLKFLNKVKTKDIAIFCRQFYTMLNAGVTIVSCLDILRVQTESKSLKRIMNEVYDDVVRGKSFTDSMNKHKADFPELLLSMVEAGEISGNLDGIMNRMSTHYENENKINKKIKGAMIYPVILILLSIGVVILLLTFVMPMFIEMFEDSGTLLPLPTRILMGASNFLKSKWYIIIALVGSIVYVVTRYVKTDTGRYQVDTHILKIPVVGKSMKKIATSRFSRTLSTLLYSGVPLIEALDIVGRVIGNRVIQSKLMVVKDEISRGTDLSGPMKQIKEFPPMLNHMVEIGEQSGSIDEIMEKTADFYDDEVDAAIKAMTTMIEPLMIIFMAVIIGGMVIAMMLPMFEMVNTIQ